MGQTQVFRTNAEYWLRL